MTTPLHRIRDLILPLLVDGTSMKEMLATVLHYNNLEPRAGSIHCALSELRDMGYVVVSDGERWWLEQGGNAA